MIRSAHLGDEGGIARVHVQSWEETYRGKLPGHAIDAQPLERRIEEWRAQLQMPGQWTYVHETDGIIDGFAMAHRSAQEPGFDAHLSTLYVLRSGQGRGIARALLCELSAALMTAGMTAMWLLTLRDENPARAFYERLGARLIREQPAPAALGAGVMDVVYGFDTLERLRGRIE